MAAYAVSARISEVRPYRTSRRGATAGVAARIVEATRPPGEEAAVEFDGRDLAGPSWADILLGWTETTFFLFDPQSWR
jgi:hypothetical protein